MSSDLNSASSNSLTLGVRTQGILYNELDYSSSLGFASVGMNTGYNGSSGAPLLHNSNAIADYVYRSAHTGTVAGKELTKLFYGAPSRKSYYLGCSSGGRQGFKEAQEFPGDFDGILAGAPALALTRLVSWGGYLSQTVGSPDSETFVTAENWALVYDELLRQCDKLDGVVDGLLENPNQCDFIPEVLVCKHGWKKGCLTPKQVEAVRNVFSPLYGVDGQLLLPRMPPGINTKREVPFYLNGQPSHLTEVSRPSQNKKRNCIVLMWKLRNGFDMWFIMTRPGMEVRSRELTLLLLSLKIRSTSRHGTATSVRSQRATANSYPTTGSKTTSSLRRFRRCIMPTFHAR